MTKILQLIFILLTVTNSNEDIPCLKQSPSLQMTYNYNNIKNQGGVLFCSEVSQRTCCDKNNFDKLQRQWIKVLYASKDIISTSCLQKYREILCSECDGSVSQGIIQGLCPFQCDEFYNNCKNDYFKFDNLSFNFCDQNALLCSKLNDIFDDSHQFCKEMQFPVNTNKNCFNLVSSQLIHGSAKNKVYYYQQDDINQSIFQRILSFLKNIFI